MLVYRATSSLCKYGYSVYPQQNQVAAVGVNCSRMNNNRNIIIGGGGERIRSRCFTRAASSSSSSQVTIGFITTTAAAAILFSMVGTNAITNAIELRSSQQLPETLSDIPQMLSGECSSSSSSNSGPQDCKKARIQRPKSRKAESCTIKCVTTCIRGGVGSPGEGPLNVRRPLVVFKQGFRSRQYCLVECSDICNLIGDGDDGP